ncbi:MAG: malto-oligosyltrehalose synthase [Elusimicrobia bacterium RIFCSPLOWO2_01_FULL_64_13]|nr:MAG: malto-oligosyltrehalose synthase [Elusimicrobia bacterium RIFCSPHIGHO2_01_FULL_64_10]OGR94558.1 MAG: malto-oligosyltrehalose synthase [Elusimicrobia bacterium RIFCSPLOWO2_01_FULL_64_13]
MTGVPASTYRLQLKPGFTFRDAMKVLPYLKRLGIGALYTSPIFQTAPGSDHGYNVTDPTRINAELGSEEDFRSFREALRDNGLGWILDVVPNHMGLSGNNNPWWRDVLENGPSSAYAKFFDIDWEPVTKELTNKILIPILGDHYGAVLEKGELRLEFSDGAFSVRTHDHLFPIAPETYPAVLENGIGELRESLGEAGKDFQTYLSVLTAFRNLPPRTTRDPDKLAERRREKEVAKGRLAELCRSSGAVASFVRGRVRLYNGGAGDPRSYDPLHALLDAQAYRLAFWQVASEAINYRRFFDINDLAAIRIEDEEVFDVHHRLAFELIRDGSVQGLRVDHPDGLYDPPEYFRRLQDRYASLDAGRAASSPLYVVVEKILDRKESLPGDWKVSGTVGYEFLNALNGLFVPQDREADFDRIYKRFTGSRIDFDTLLYEKKKFYALIHMSSEINTLGHRLDVISEQDRHTRDFTWNNLTLAIREVAACFPVYRTYIRPGASEISERDRRYIHLAIEKAKVRTPALNPALYDFLRDILTLAFPAGMEEPVRDLLRDFILRFQQISPPIMAKGLEDTAFYIHSRLLSLNEVGGDPTLFGRSAAEFHRQNQDRNASRPAGLTAGSTHDTKRSEDVRMRINVLSEIPEEWSRHLRRWALSNKKHKTPFRTGLEPGRNTEYYLYQTLLGVWPDEPLTEASRRSLEERVWQYMLKSIREAKTMTNWVNPNPAYEEAVRKFVLELLSPRKNNFFMRTFIPFQKKVSEYGKLNSLSAQALRLGSPGVFDLYQGNEVWDYSLVDPDNRRPVDFGLRERLLSNIEAPAGPGTPATFSPERKLRLLRTGLALRAKNRDLFVGGDYIPLEAGGKRSRNIVAFARRRGDDFAIFAAGRFFTEIFPDPARPRAPEEAWRDTALALPAELRNRPLKNLLTGKLLRAPGGPAAFPVRTIFDTWTAAILIPADGKD